MTVLHKELRARAQRSRLMEQSLYREELQRLAAERAAHLERAHETTTHIARLLQGATQAGVSMVEIAALTGFSRPTLYRMLAEVRADQDVRALAGQLEHAIAKAKDDLGQEALLNPLADYVKMDVDELRLRLEQVFPHVRREIEAFDASGLTQLVDLLPGLPKVEKIILSQLFLQRRSIDEVARSIAHEPRDVIVWGALAVLRVLPALRSAASAA